MARRTRTPGRRTGPRLHRQQHVRQRAGNAGTLRRGRPAQSAGDPDPAGADRLQCAKVPRVTAGRREAARHRSRFHPQGPAAGAARPGGRPRATRTRRPVQRLSPSFQAARVSRQRKARRPSSHQHRPPHAGRPRGGVPPDGNAHGNRGHLRATLRGSRTLRRPRRTRSGFCPRTLQSRGEHPRARDRLRRSPRAAAGDRLDPHAAAQRDRDDPGGPAAGRPLHDGGTGPRDAGVRDHVARRTGHPTRADLIHRRGNRGPGGDRHLAAQPAALASHASA